MNDYDGILLEFVEFYKDGFTYEGETYDKQGNLVKLRAYSVAEYRDVYTKSMTILQLMPETVTINGTEYDWSEPE